MEDDQKKSGSQTNVAIPLEETGAKNTKFNEYEPLPDAPPVPDTTTASAPEPPPYKDTTHANGQNGMTTSFTNPNTQAPPDIEEKAAFLERDIESQDLDDDGAKSAKKKALEAGGAPEGQVQMTTADMFQDENEFWTDEDEEEDEEAQQARKSNILARIVLGMQSVFKMSYTKITTLTKGYLFKAIFFIGFLVYFVLAMNYEFGSEASQRLLVCTMLGLLIMFWDYLARAMSFLSKKLYGSNSLTPPHKAILGKVRVVIRWTLYLGLAAIMVYVLVEEGRNKPENLRSLPGLFLFLLILLLCCPNPHMINWHTVYWAMGLQFLFALAVLKWETGKEAVVYVQSRLDEFFECTKVGSKFVFGKNWEDHRLIFGAMPIVFFTNAVLTVLYYLGAIQYLVKVLGGFLNFVLDTSPAESTAVAASLFMEGIPAILVLKEYLPFLSKSQLFLVVTSAFASLGGAYLAILSQIGINLEYLLSAMVISAPATFAVCKIMVPETKWTKKKDKGRQANIANGGAEKAKYNNVLDAAQTGAVMMLSLVGNVIVIIFTFFSAIEWFNKTLTWFGDRVGIEKLTIELIASYVFYPVALMMGIEPDDCRSVGMLLGYRLSMNNMIGFYKLRMLQVNKMLFNKYKMMTGGRGPVVYDGDDIRLVFMNKTLVGGFMSDRSEAIATYSLCGFSSMMSVMIMMGVLSALVPNRKKWILSMIIPGLLAGNIANCMSGCFASIFYTD